MKRVLVVTMVALWLMCQAVTPFSITDLPCIQRLNQLYCKDQGTQYPADRIDQFIDLNKALTLRMFGNSTPNDVITGGGPPNDVITGGTVPSDSFADIQSVHTEQLPEYSSNQTWRSKESANATVATRAARRRTKRDQPIPEPPKIDKNSEHRVDSCESTMEIMTPFWAENSAKEVRVIVNTKSFPQAIRVEICSRPTTSYCSGNCLCEQKYTWYRLLAYDPGNDCNGIFIDWFLYPSCCVCRCKP